MVRRLNKSVVQRALATIHERITDAVDRMKTNAQDIPLLAVGGGAMLIPEQMPGISEVVHVEHEAVANAVGAAIAQISGETDQIYRDLSREDAIEAAKKSAIEKAVEAGALQSTIEVVEIEDLPLSYLPGQAIRARVRVVGDVAG